MTEPALFHCWSQVGLISFSLRKKCFYSKLFWSAFSRVCTEHGEIRIISPYSVQMWENAEQNNSVYGHFQYNFKRLNYLSDVEFVTCIAKINFSSLMTSAKWLLTIRSYKTSASPIGRTEMISNSLQYSESVSSCTWNRLSSNSLQYIDKTSSYSAWNSSHFAALIRKFSNLMYDLKILLVKAISDLEGNAMLGEGCFSVTENCKGKL